MTCPVRDGEHRLYDSPEFDVCVIGAGAAGLVLTERLTRSGTQQVCLLEAGPERFKDCREPFVVQSSRKLHLGVNEGRVTAFGGATNTWGGGLIRHLPTDFEPLQGRPDTAWPFSYETIVGHYEAVESLFGIRTPAEASGNLFLEDTDFRVLRRAIPVLLFRNKNFAKRFGRTLRARQNLTILCSCHICRFVPSPSGGVSHVTVRIKGGAETTIRARRFVISAGIVNSYLLAERILDACGIERIGENAGRYFHDHISFPIAVLHPQSQSKFSRRFGYRFEDGLMLGEHFDIESTTVRSPGAYLHLAFDTSSSSVLRPVREILNAVQRRTITFQSVLSPKELAPLCLGLPRLGLMRYLHRRLYLDRGTKILATLDLEQVPFEECALEKGRDGNVCTVTWDVSLDDARHAARLLPVCRAILEKLQAEAQFDMEDLIPDVGSDADRLLQHMKKNAIDTYHSAGGLRMHHSTLGLVDGQLRLATTRNVYILSSAVFPRVGTANPTLTLLAIANRLAEHLLDVR